MIQSLISPIKTEMILPSNSFQLQLYRSQHLELDFGKNSLNTTCQSKINLEQTVHQQRPTIIIQDITNKQQRHIHNKSNLTTQRKSARLNKSSRCFMNQISKVLKKNKINCTADNNSHNPIFSGQNMSIDMSFVDLRAKTDGKTFKVNEEIKKIIKKGSHKKENYNFEDFLQHMSRKNQINQINQSQATKVNNHNNFIKSSHKVKATGLRSSNADLSNMIDSQVQSINQFSQNLIPNFKTHKSTISIIENIQDEIKQPFKKSRFQLNSVKSSRMLTVKQSRKLQTTRKNQKESSSLRKSLKKAMSNIMLNPKSQQKSANATQRAGNRINDRKDKELNYAQNMQIIHFEKLKERVMGKMEDWKKINEIRSKEEKQRKKLKKKRAFSAQQKFTLSVQGTNMVLGKTQENEKKDTQFKHRRPYTALSRTGLQYDRRTVNRRGSSDKEYRMMPLAGINNSANHFRTFSKNANREIEDLDQCNSDRAIKTLREKFSKSRPQTAKSRDKQMSSRPSSTGRRMSKNNGPNEQYDKILQSMRYEKVTRKEVEKEKIKQKLFELLIQCEEEKVCNQNLKQGLDIFEDYCDNIDKGLKGITEQIDKYIKQNQ